jgi:hypothetical protein
MFSAVIFVYLRGRTRSLKRLPRFDDPVSRVLANLFLLPYVVAAREAGQFRVRNRSDLAAGLRPVLPNPCDEPGNDP